MRALEKAGANAPTNVNDLYLAQACLNGDRRALDVLESQLLPQVKPSVVRVCGTDLIDDVLQATREKLLVGGPDRVPKLTQYTGDGSLVGWLRVVAVRDAVAVRRLKVANTSTLEEAAESLGAPATAHDALLRKTHAAEFKAAVEEGIRRLSVQERNMLRMSVLDKMSIDDLAALFRMHRSTAARRLSRARESVLDHAHTRLRQDLGLSASEAGSLCGDLAGQINLTLSRVLGPRGES